MLKKKETFINFQKPYFIGTEIKEVSKTIKKKQLIGPENYILKAENLLEKQLNCKKVLLTSSGTHALEMACILANFGPGDEVIMPSFNFPSSGTSVIRTGAKPVFVDISSKDMNVSLDSIKNSITRATKGLIIVHYAGISAQIDDIIKFAKKFNLIVIEDAAPAIYSKYKNKYLGTLGDFGILSFHFTKNVFCGEGGALLINKKKDIVRAQVIREKGTNRFFFSKGKISKYTWIDQGSSFIPSSLQASFLYAQLKTGTKITKKRISIFRAYDKFFKNNPPYYQIETPQLEKFNIGNGHFYWILIPKNKRKEFLEKSKIHGLELTTHYEPLHNSKAGKKFGKSIVNLKNTENLSKRILRIPIHTQMKAIEQKLVLKILKKTIDDCLT